jgi:hypothetical protein
MDGVEKMVEMNVWGRLPAPGGRLEGLSRTTLCELSVPSALNNFKPPVRSILIRKKNAVRGIRLLNLPSLHDYLQSLGAENES